MAFNQAAAGSIPVGPVLILYLTFHLVPKHEVISESEKEVLQQNSDFDINNLPKIKINDPVVKELAKSNNVSAGDVLRITRNSKTAGEFISYRIVIEG
ncbi:DNA-directed RNA polymerase subunit H [uncultured Methanobrevibacter sp.]|uniref:DNA-directed RNA polymerase subunit H n=1 Tax=uncultured Methanobrevibacter sp. TaxID=253161 RepID=UPI0025D44F13|nr:DNA-directed RNA polymerase subunit H [uncultured Methanobrevibacter sp.]